MFSYYAGAATGLALGGMITGSATLVAAALILALIAVGVAIKERGEV